MEYKELQEKYGRIASHPDEKSRRLRCADEALATGRGGITVVSEATGVSRTAITEGIKEITGKKRFLKTEVSAEKGAEGRKKQSGMKISGMILEIRPGRLHGETPDFLRDGFVKVREILRRS